MLCTALPMRGPSFGSGPGSAEQRYTLHHVRDTKASPPRKHSRLLLQYRRDRIDQARGRRLHGEPCGVDHSRSAGVKRLAALQDGAQLRHGRAVVGHRAQPHIMRFSDTNS
jgi:hypothetical protein